MTTINLDDDSDEIIVIEQKQVRRRRSERPTTHAEGEEAAQRQRRERDAMVSPIARRNRELKALATGQEYYIPQDLAQRIMACLGVHVVDVCSSDLGHVPYQAGYRWVAQGPASEDTITDTQGNVWDHSGNSVGYVDSDNVLWYIAQDDGLRADWTGDVYMYPPHGDTQDFRPELCGTSKRIENIWWQKLCAHVSQGDVKQALVFIPDIGRAHTDHFTWPMVVLNEPVGLLQPLDTCQGKALPGTDLVPVHGWSKRSALVYLSRWAKNPLPEYFGDIGQVLCPI